MKQIYEPREDSFLLLEHVRRFSHGHVLDMGTGSGILALQAAKTADFVVGVDVNEDALSHAEKLAKKGEVNNVKFVLSDLFDYFRRDPWLFDLIIFNPPYLPEDLSEPDDSALATTGGRHGFELLERFLSFVSRFLKHDGKILIVFSSLTNQHKVEEFILSNGFSFQKLSEQDLFAETLYTYLIEKSDFLQKVEARGVFDLHKVAQGHRGEIFSGLLDGKKVAVKKQRSDIPVINRVVNEARWLKVLNRKGVGPKILFSEDDFFIYEWVDGLFVNDWLKNADKHSVSKMFVNVLDQCFLLDKMLVSKEEMTNPYKHIIVGDIPVMIDFERMHSTEHPQNVTQFCQYLGSKKVLSYLRPLGFKVTKAQLVSAAKKYKKNPCLENFTQIVSFF